MSGMAQPAIPAGLRAGQRRANPADVKGLETAAAVAGRTFGPAESTKPCNSVRKPPSRVLRSREIAV